MEELTTGASWIAVIFGAIYSGSATPTEAGALGAMVVFCFYIYRAYRERAFGQMRANLTEALVETAKLTAMIEAWIVPAPAETAEIAASGAGDGGASGVAAE